MLIIPHSGINGETEAAVEAVAEKDTVGVEVEVDLDLYQEVVAKVEANLLIEATIEMKIEAKVEAVQFRVGTKRLALNTVIEARTVRDQVWKRTIEVRTMNPLINKNISKRTLIHPTRIKITLILVRILQAYRPTENATKMMNHMIWMALLMPAEYFRANC